MEDENLTEVTTDQLEQVLSSDERLIGRLRYRQLAILAELDRRQVPTADGCRSLSEWASGRLDVAPETARGLVRTGRRLAEQPELAERLAEGEVTFDRAEALARLSPDDGFDSACHDIAGLRRRAARHRRLSRRDEQAAFDARRLYLQPSLDESWYRVWGDMDGYGGRLFDKALQERAEQLPTPLQAGSRAQRYADALVSIAQDSLTGTAGTDNGTPLITVFVDASTAAATQGETGAWISDGPRVGPATIERILCEGTTEVIARTEDGQPLAVGRASRAIPLRLRRFVLARDGGCTADGCTSRYRLQPHHRIPWSHGGPTDPDNLTTLCWYHHHVVIHGQGHEIDPTSPAGRIRFRSPVGTRSPP